MIKPRISILHLSLILLFILGQVYCDQCSETDKQFLTTFHPHLDAFWLNFDNQLKDINFTPAGFLYAMNQRNSKTIFNSMLQALLQSPDRKYFITEIVFLKDWYDYLSSDKKIQVENLIKNGQLEIANGAWVQNDEAVCYMDDILDQYTIGHQFLRSKFGYQVKIGWATDSFGHSNSQAALQHLLGIQFQGIQRVDDRYVNQHNDGALLQFYWSAYSDSNNRTYGGLLNHIRHFLHEVNNLRISRGSSIKSDYQQLHSRMQQVYHKKKLFRFLGNDFQQFISSQFTNLENALKQLNNQSQNRKQCPMYKYGNPLDYLNSITQQYQRKVADLPTRKYDFIPNWDQDRFWSGYYTTDPELKKSCKDFSRLVNLFRKIVLTQNVKFQDVSDTLRSSEQLLAVLQHHDGITATSKTYIEDQFRKRIDKRNQLIMGQINNIYNLQKQIHFTCQLYKDNNICYMKPELFETSSNQFTLSIISLGNSKLQKIQLHNLPKDVFLEVRNTKYEIICEEKPMQQCRVLFQAAIFSGINQFKLLKKTKQELKDKITEMQLIQGAGEMIYSGRGFSIGVNGSNNQIKYQFSGSQFLSFGFYTSENKGSTRTTKSWDKYGRKSDNNQRIMPGMYIMSNSGQISKLQHSYISMKISQGQAYRKIILRSNVIKIQLTINNDQPNIVDIVYDFKPPTRTTLDYFLKVSSKVKSDTLYHDSNGFLVNKRIKNWRPDYKFDYKPEDQINGNNYPATSFAYLLDENKKMLFSSDRAQGVSSYDKSLLINFDRLAYDDGKGVGQSYMKAVNNTFHYKFAIVSENDDLERLWQRQYDQALLAIVSPSQQPLKSLNPKIFNQQFRSLKTRYLKYTIYHLNENQIVLRLMNLAEHQQTNLLKYKKQQNSGTFQIDSLGISLNFVDIVQSYANGIPKEKKQEGRMWRKHWSNDQNQINILNQGGADTNQVMILRPLEIRSFRINFKEQIKTIQSPKFDGNLIGGESVQLKHRKRCF